MESGFDGASSSTICAGPGDNFTGEYFGRPALEGLDLIRLEVGDIGALPAETETTEEMADRRDSV